MLKRRALVQSAEDLKVAGLVSMMAFSEQPDGPHREWRGDPVAVTEVLGLNAVPLAYLRGKDNSFLSPLVESHGFMDQLHRHEAKYRQWKDAFVRVSRTFLSNGVRYAFIKSPSLFPYISGNLDVLVREEDFARAGELLDREGFVELKNIREPHKYLYKRFECGEEIIAVHLHSRVFWGATFVNPEAIWARVDGQVFDDVVFPLSAEDCLLTTLAHSFYENSAITLFDLCVVKQTVSNREVDWGYVRNTARDYRWEDGLSLSLLAYSHLNEAIFGGRLLPDDVMREARQLVNQHFLLRRAASRLEHAEPTLPFYLPLVTSKALAYKKIWQTAEMKTPVKRLFNIGKMWAELLVVHLMKINPQKGMLVALSGMDGSGKTSHAHALIETLHKCGLNVDYVWTRAGSQTGFQTVVKGLFNLFTRPDRQLGDRSWPETYRRRRTLFGSRWKFTYWRMVNVVDLCVFYNLALRLKLLRSQVVICDRFVPDIFVDLHVYQDGTPRDIWLKLLSWLLPRPAVSLLLAVPTDVALQRSRNEECVGYRERQSQLYLQAQKHLKPTVIDNAYRQFRDVCHDLTNHVVKRYYSKKCVWLGWEQDK